MLERNKETFGGALLAGAAMAVGVGLLLGEGGNKEENSIDGSTVELIDNAK